MAIISTFVDDQQIVKKLTNDVVTVQNRLNFSTTNASAADVIEAVKVPKGAMVLRVATYVSTAEGAAATADVGDGTDPNGYNDACDLNATGMETSITSTDAYNEGKLYAVDDTIDLTLGHDMDACIVDVIAEYMIIAPLANS